MLINRREIGIHHPPYIIAEMSNNHMNDLQRAFKLIELAKYAGVDAVKIQTYNAESLTIDCDKPDFVIPDKLWSGITYYDLYKEISMPFDWNKKLFDKANEVGITLFSSPFDELSVDLLEDLNCPAYKIASFEAKDYSFIKKVASTRKPIIMSTGVSSMSDIVESVEIAREHGASEVAILHCISSYPSEVTDMNVSAITELRKLGVVVGLSDHSLSDLASTMSIAYGASIIEKHYTVSRADGGPDADFSLEPEELKDLKDRTMQAWKARGNANILKKNRSGAHHARSLYFVRDLKKGGIVTMEDIRSIRPGYGLEPKFMKDVLGKKLCKDVERGDRVTWECFQ